MMSGNKTRDGLKISKLLKALTQLPGIIIREGGSHPSIAEKIGYPQPCPIATSTNVREMVVPWIKRTTSYTNAQEIYEALRRGYFT